MIEGTGLGLSLSKHFIDGRQDRRRKHAGKRHDVLSLIQGTPASTVPRPDARVSSVVELPRSTAPRTVLYIEDNLSNLRLVERILARRARGKADLRKARQHRPRTRPQHQLDLVLLDIHLPDIQGNEILRLLRADARTAHLQIVMISADATSAQIHSLRAAGANDYLTKPIDVCRFLAVVDATAPRESCAQQAAVNG